MTHRHIRVAKVELINVHRYYLLTDPTTPMPEFAVCTQERRSSNVLVKLNRPTVVSTNCPLSCPDPTKYGLKIPNHEDSGNVFLHLREYFWSARIIKNGQLKNKIHFIRTHFTLSWFHFNFFV